MNNLEPIKPVVLTDLDDTLFQTKRKMQQELALDVHEVAALDRSLQPRSFMSQEQALFVQWLFQHADLIPVTARGTQEIQRVTLPFNSWMITTHGAVILNSQGEIDESWKSHILHEIAPYRQRLIDLQQNIAQQMENSGLDAWVRINYEYDNVPIYFVMKHRDSNKIAELYEFADKLENMFGTDGFYIHRNGNNIAWIPLPIEKGKAAQWLVDKLRAERGIFPLIGMGDSLSDYSFMKQCSWYCIPKQSQFTQAIKQLIFGEEI